MSTNGNAIAGCLAATLASAEVENLIEQGPEASIAGSEVYFDAAAPAHSISRLVRNPECRFPHDRLAPKTTTARTLAQAFDATPGPRSEKNLRALDSAFVSRLLCEACDYEDKAWRIRATLDATALSCPRCGAPRAIRGFDLEDRIPGTRLTRAEWALPLSALGFRAGDGFALDSAGGDDVFLLADAAEAETEGEGEARGATVVLAGLGNIGSFLVPLLTRISLVERLLLADPDHYAPGQALSQDATAGDVGRAKVDVQAARAKAIRPDLPVEAHATRVERLPLGHLQNAIVVSALDTRAARLQLAARAWRIGSPFVDAAVAGGASLLVRTNVYVPGPDAACFECAFDDAEYAALEQIYPCQTAGAHAHAAATRHPRPSAEPAPASTLTR